MNISVSPFSRSGRRLFGAALLTAAMVAPSLSGPVQAAAVPFTDQSVSISARGQPVRDFVTDLFTEAGLTAKVSTAATGKVQGVFRGSPKKIWQEVSQAFNLIAYWDGGVVRVYSTSEVASRSIPTSTGAAVIAQAEQLKLTDSVNTARVADGMIFATGVPAFLDRLEGMAKQMKFAQDVPQVQPLSPTRPGPIATPRQTVSSQVIRSAGRRNPFEVRMFYLKYRDAADSEIRSSDRITVIPGVATLLNEQMGDARNLRGLGSNGVNTTPTGGVNMVRPRASDSREDDRRGEEGGAPSSSDLDGPRISADPTVNAVIVRDRPEAMSVYEKLIASLDIEPLMVETQVTIVEINRTKLKEMSMDFGFGIEGLAMLFGGGPGFGPGGITGGYLSGDGDVFLARIKALDKRGALRFVTRPVLSTANNKPAIFDITTQQLVKLEGEREVDALTVSYGLAMRVTPSAIEQDGQMRIRMDIEISDTQLNGMVVDGVPTATGPRISTETIVGHGESVLLAGMSQSRDYEIKQKTPFLSAIPIIGDIFFKKRWKSSDNWERLFLLTPRVSNLGGQSFAAAQVQPLTMEQLRGEAPIQRGRQ